MGEISVFTNPPFTKSQERDRIEYFEKAILDKVNIHRDWWIAFELVASKSNIPIYIAHIKTEDKEDFDVIKSVLLLHLPQIQFKRMYREV